MSSWRKRSLKARGFRKWKSRTERAREIIERGIDTDLSAGRVNTYSGLAPKLAEQASHTIDAIRYAVISGGFSAIQKPTKGN